MKKIIVVAFLSFLAYSGYAQKKKFVTFQAEIANRNSDYIFIQTPKRKIIKKIDLNSQGIFKDTLTVKEAGIYQLYDGSEFTSIYLKNGYDLKLTMDAKQFDESIVYTGKGAAENNHLAQNALYEEKYDYDTLLASKEAEFEKLLGQKKTNELAKLVKVPLDADFVAVQTENIDGALEELRAYYKENQEKKKLNNSDSPLFDYENAKGGKTKLEDLRGKYVYIDVWATWCGPCRAEIPFLKKAEEKYHGKNIEFVSISVDVAKDHEKWATFVKDKQLGGTQLFADNNWNSSFIKAFAIESIPRFILIDPKGKIVDADALRPSNPALLTLLDELLAK